MNKQELIKRIKNLPYLEGPIADTVTVNRSWILYSIEQLDESQKVTVPQFVADWYEEHKDDFEIALFRCIDHIPSVYDEGDLNEFEEWIIDGETKPFQTLVNMHQFGYKVKKEKRYLVKMKSLGTNFSFLNLNKTHNHWMFSSKNECDIYQVRHTRKELEEAGFGWVFDCEGMEVEEVEE